VEAAATRPYVTIVAGSRSVANQRCLALVGWQRAGARAALPADVAPRSSYSHTDAAAYSTGTTALAAGRQDYGYMSISQALSHLQ